MRKLGLIAGKGNLPKAVAAEARSLGYHVTTIALEPVADDDLESFADVTLRISVGKLGEIIASLKEAGIREAVMAGKVPKSLLYKNKVIPDLRAVKVLFTLKDRSDDSILVAVAHELEKDGIVLRNTVDFTPQLLAPDGVLTAKPPSDEEWKDIEFGWKIAKEMGRLDIGQTVVIKNRAVMAIEAIEGTDEAILRGGRLAGSGAVIVKVSKPGQDLRFDVPVVGPDTLNSLIKAGGRVLAIETGSCILMERERMVTEADRAGISIVGYSQRV